MSKFDADRLTKEQLLRLACREIERAKIWDGDVALNHNDQALLDAARVPEPKTAAELEGEFISRLIERSHGGNGMYVGVCDSDLAVIIAARKREAGEG